MFSSISVTVGIDGETIRGCRTVLRQIVVIFGKDKDRWANSTTHALPNLSIMIEHIRSSFE